MLGRWGDWIYYNLSQDDMRAKQLLLNDYKWLSITNPYKVKTKNTAEAQQVKTGGGEDPIYIKCHYVTFHSDVIIFHFKRG